MVNWGRLLMVWAVFVACPQAMAADGSCKIMLVPGAFGVGTSSWFLKFEDYFSEYRAFFRAKGCGVRTVEFPPDATIEVRARMLRDQVEGWVKQDGGAVSLIAHSQAGLDGRFALKDLGLKGVRALVTVGVPHRGTPAADWTIAQRDKRTWLYWALRWIGNYDLDSLPFVREMTGAFLNQYASHFEMVSGVRYASVETLCHSGCHWALVLLSKWASVPEGDGIVPVQSQSFGEVLGRYDLDHISEVGADAGKRGERTKLLNAIWAFLSSLAS